MKPLRSGSRSITGLATELVIVFVGVALALAAENWREARADRIEVHEGLRVMIDDLGNDRDAFEQLAESFDEKAVLTAWLVDNRDRTAPPVDSVESALHRVFGEQTTITRSSAAWRGMESGGQVAIVEPDSLRQAILSYYENRMTAHDYWLGIINDTFENGIFPRLWTHTRLPGGAEPGTLWPPSEQTMPLVTPWAEFQDDLALQNQIVMGGRLVDYTAGHLRESARRADALRSMILAELGTPPP